MRRTRSVVPLALLAAILALPAASPAAVDGSASAERKLASLLKGSRDRAGLGDLRISARLTDIARKHARRMAQRGEVSHNPWLYSSEGRKAMGHPRAIGENVGVGGGAKPVHDGFMRSDGHRANILRGGFAEVGVGAVRDGDTLWVVEVFVRPGSGSGGGSVGSAPAPRAERRSPPDRAARAPGPEAAADPEEAVAEPQVGHPTGLVRTAAIAPPAPDHRALLALGGLGFVLVLVALYRAPGS